MLLQDLEHSVGEDKTEHFTGRNHNDLDGKDDLESGASIVVGVYTSATFQVDVNTWEVCVEIDWKFLENGRKCPSVSDVNVPTLGGTIARA